MTTVEKLTRQQNAIGERIGKIADELLQAKNAVGLADQKLDQAIRAELRTEATTADVTAAKDALNRARSDLEAVERLNVLAKHEAVAISRELMQAKQDAKKALQARIHDECEAIAARIKKDSKLRSALLEIYGLQSSDGDGVVDWSLLLTNIFNEPDEHEHHQAVSAARKHLGIN